MAPRSPMVVNVTLDASRVELSKVRRALCLLALHYNPGADLPREPSPSRWAVGLARAEAEWTEDKIVAGKDLGKAPPTFTGEV